MQDSYANLNARRDAAWAEQEARMQAESQKFHDAATAMYVYTESVKTLIRKELQHQALDSHTAAAKISGTISDAIDRVLQGTTALGSSFAALDVTAEHVNGLETHLFTSLTSNWV